MSWRPQINDRGVIIRFSNSDTGEVITTQEYERRMQMLQGSYTPSASQPGINSGANPMMAPAASQSMDNSPAVTMPTPYSSYQNRINTGNSVPFAPPDDPAYHGMAYPMPQLQTQALPMNMSNQMQAQPAQSSMPVQTQQMPALAMDNPLVQPGAQILAPGGTSAPTEAPSSLNSMPVASSTGPMPQEEGAAPTPAGGGIQGKNLRLEGMPGHLIGSGPTAYRPHGFLDATSIAILLPTLILVALSIAAAHKKRLFPWQTIRTFSPPSGLMSPRDYEKSFLCPPNLRRHGRLGRRNPNATWTDADGVVLPFGFLARTHLPVTIPLGRLPNKNMFIVAPTGSGKTTLMRAIIKALMAKPCVIVALEAKANDPHLDELKDGFKFTVLPEAKAAGFDTLYFNPLDSEESINWNPLDLSPLTFASSIVQGINSLAPEEQHWAERDHGYIAGLTQLLKWGAVQVAGEDEEGFVSEVIPLPCNPRGLMRLVNNRRNIVESLRRLKDNPDVDPAELSELTQTLSSIIRTDTDWDKNIQGVRGRLRMFKNPSIIRVTEQSNVDIQASMHKPTVLIFGAPASLGPDAESLASCFVYQLQQALHTRYGIASILPLFAFFDEYQTLNLDIAGRLSAIVRGANGGLTVILQNVSQITGSGNLSNPNSSGGSELRTIFSNAAVRVCLHNADEATSRFFSDEIGKHAVIVPGLSDHFKSQGFGVFPTSWNRIHSQQVVPRVDPDSIKRMEKQHALVYLSPAGDPEFGEVKPLMVDLRGIEQIARLHLLHNIPGRFAPPSGSEAVPAAPTHVPWQSHLGQGGFTGATAENIANAVQGQFGITSAAGAIPTGTNSMTVGKLADTLSGAIPSSVPVPIGQAANNSPAQQSSGGQTQRLCPACNQPVVNKKFCTKCGALLGPPAIADSAGQTPQRVELETSAVVVGRNENRQSGQASTTAASPPFPFAAPTNQPEDLTPGSSQDRQTIGKVLRQTYTQSVETDQVNPAPRRTITSFNPDLPRPVPKLD